MQVAFQKMHGLGNDFAIIDQRGIASESDFSLSAQTISALADRKTGIGFDQLLLIQHPQTDDTQAYYEIYNADGQSVEQCGNGARCIAAALGRTDHIGHHQRFLMGSPGGVVAATLLDGQSVEIDMGKPDFEPSAVPLRAASVQNLYTFEVDGNTVQGAAVSIGNPHCVLFVDDVQIAPVATLGAALCDSAHFPEGVNVGFAEIVDRQSMRLRVFERGVGETRACGTGACAAMVCAQRNGHVGNRVEITLPGGSLVINWAGDGHNIVMTGPASFSYEGIVQL